MSSEPDVQVALWSYKANLLKAFSEKTGAAKTMSMDLFLDDLFDHGTYASARLELRIAPALPPGVDRTPPQHCSAAAPLLPMPCLPADVELGGAHCLAGIIRDQTLTPTAAVVGDVLTPVQLSLSLLDAKGAFFSGQAEGPKLKSAIDFDEWCVCLALCGHTKYANVGAMSLAQRVSATLDNYLGTRDELAAVSAAVVCPTFIEQRAAFACAAMIRLPLCADCAVR